MSLILVCYQGTAETPASGPIGVRKFCMGSMDHTHRTDRHARMVICAFGRRDITIREVMFGMLMGLTITAAAAEEDIGSANHILPGCKQFIERTGLPSPPEALNEGVCIGAVQAIAFIHKQCADIPSGVTTGQLIRVVIRYIEARPKRMNETFAALVAEALVDAWPCRK
jgi:hypothetical protein